MLILFPPLLGTFAVVSIMSGNAVDRIVAATSQPAATTQPITSFPMSESSSVSPTMNTSGSVVDDLDAEKIKIHTALCLLVGILQVRHLALENKTSIF